MKTKEVAMETATKKKVYLVVHTTCGVAFEIIPADKDGEPDFEGSLTGRWDVADEPDDEYYDEDAEQNEKDRLKGVFERKGWELVGEIWS
jgi:1-acyl-sn-glycerol-3-phosphate acyltransferase